MTRAIWGIIYDLPESGRDEYLAWFHDVHMPEKLARPGYAWAAHYEVVSPQARHITSLAGNHDGKSSHGYIALFGGDDTQVFLNPSPAQIKPNQTPLTREMMGRRIAQRSFIAAVEWCMGGRHSAKLAASPVIHLTCCDAPQRDESFGAWCVQQLAPVLSRDPALSMLGKMLTATGPIKHVILAGFESVPREQVQQAEAAIAHMEGSPFLARRISYLPSAAPSDT